MSCTHLQSMFSIPKSTLPFNHSTFPLPFLFSKLTTLLNGCISFFTKLLLVLHFNCHISLYFDHLSFQKLFLFYMLVNYSIFLLDLCIVSVFLEGDLFFPILLRLFGLNNILFLFHYSRPSFGFLPNLNIPFLSFHSQSLFNSILFGLDQLISPFNLDPQLIDLSFVILLLSCITIEFGLIEAAFFIQLTIVSS